MDIKKLTLLSFFFLLSANALLPMLKEHSFGVYPLSKSKIVKKKQHATGNLESICEFTKTTRQNTEIRYLKARIRAEEERLLQEQAILKQKNELTEKEKSEAWEKLKSKVKDVLDPQTVLTIAKDKIPAAGYILSAATAFNLLNVAKECAELCKAGRSCCACTNFTMKISWPLLKSIVLTDSAKFIARYAGLADPVSFQQKVVYYACLYSVHQTPRIVSCVNDLQIPQKISTFLATQTLNAALSLNSLLERLSMNRTLTYTLGK